MERGRTIFEWPMFGLFGRFGHDEMCLMFEAYPQV